MTDEQREAAAIIAAQIAEQQYSEDFVNIMATQLGRRFIWTSISKCRVFLPVFSQDHAQMSFDEGRRQVGLMFLTMIGSECPELFAVMTAENQPKKEDLKA